MEVVATTPGGTNAAPVPTPPAGTDPVQDEVTLDAVRKAFEDMGLGDLFGQVTEMYKQGIKDKDSILFRLRDTDVYKKRFKANEARRKAGLPELSPGTYVALEQQYRQLMQEAMLPVGFYDNPEDFTGMIERDIAPTEVQKRVTMAAQSAVNADPALVKSLKSMYGVGEADVIAYFLDPEKAVSVLDRRYNASQFQAAAQRIGQQYSTQFAEEAGQASGGNRVANDQVFSSLKDDFAATERLNANYGGDLTSEDLARSAFNLEGSNVASDKKRRLASQDRSAFAGSSGTAAGSLSKRKRLA